MYGRARHIRRPPAACLGSEWLQTRLPSSYVSALTGGAAVAFPSPRSLVRVDLYGPALPDDPAGILRSGAPRGVGGPSSGGASGSGSIRAGHDLLLASVYEEALAGSESLYTNYTATYRGTLDYIWVDASRVRPLAVL